MKYQQFFSPQESIVEMEISPDTNPNTLTPPQTGTISMAAISHSLESISISKPSSNQQISEQPIFQPHKSVYNTLLLNDIRHGIVDLKTPYSLIAKTGLCNLLTMNTFNQLTQNDQHALVKLLPAVDQVGDNLESALNNAYLKKYCEMWCERLSDGDLMGDSNTRAKVTTLENRNAVKRVLSSTEVNDERTEKIMKMDMP